MGIPLRLYWRLLSRYLVSRRGAAITVAVLLLANTAVGLAAPQVVRAFIDASQAGAPVPLLLQAGAVYLLFRLGDEVLRVLANHRVAVVAWSACNALRTDLVAHLMRLDLGFHKAHPPGELIELVDGDVQALAYFLSDLIVGIVNGVLMLLGILVAVAIEDLLLGVLFLAYAAIALAVLTWVQRFGPPHWRADRECASRFWGDVGELLTAREDLQTCGATGYATRRFESHLRRWRPVKLRAASWLALWLVTGVVHVAGEGLSWGVGGPMVRGGTLSLGTLFMIGLYLEVLVWGPIEAIQWQLHGLQRARVSIERVQQLFNIRSALVDGTMALPEGALSVTVRDIWFGYQDGVSDIRANRHGPEGRAEAPGSESATAKSPGSDAERELDGAGKEDPESSCVLRGVSFEVPAGRVLGLLGRTGSGKTTVARLLFRWYDPQEGEIRLGGVDIRQAGIEAVRSRVGLVTQDVQLLQASLRDNLTLYDPTIPDEALLAALGALGLGAWLEELPGGLDAPISADTLSAGEAQLVALARVFIQDPDLVVLDEASSRLDPATEALLGRALHALLTGRTAVIIAHRLQTVVRADEIVILAGGQVLEAGPRRTLATDPGSHFAHLLRTGIGDVLL
jgi:ABC-type multidrug transport system fused ATPase/permease subunit